MDPSAVHIFWDNSNLFHRAQGTCDDLKKGTGLEQGHRLDLRLNFDAIMKFASAGRSVEKAVAVGSVPPALQAIWESLGSVGVIVDLQERGAESGKEQGVDQALQLEMMNSILDRNGACVAVLLTGDGGFVPAVQRMVKNGWGVEVLSFSDGFSPRLRKAASRALGGRGRYVELDDWYYQLTYLQSPSGKIIRASKRLSLKGRPKL